MKEVLPPRYDPKKVEDRVYQMWEKGGHFRSKPDGRKPFTIVIPPPNITGALHMGHALNVSIQDVLIRFRRMQNYNALWLPGTDHAGIATQNVVERQLSQRNIRREDIGREKFLEEVWKWKEVYGGQIIEQLKKLGCSCDWERLRFTLDEGLSEAVVEAFVRLYEMGLIYKGLYIINWCPRCRTALSDDEVEHIETRSHLWYLRYPLKNGRGHLTVATTRPETMLGDVAVAVNPKDSRYKELIGQRLILPLVGREMPVIADEVVDTGFGTGALKVTPAHDPNDFLIGQRHGLEPVCVMNPDGTMNENAGDFAGMDRFEARKGIVRALQEQGLVEKIEPYEHSVGHCYRCQTVIEPTISEQWFVRMKPLAEKAIGALDAGKPHFRPERWKKVYLSWLENVRDWCISRQIWWGHRIPAYYCKDCSEMSVSKGRPEKCPRCGSTDLKQDEDVLDTWFSSALWPFSTLGWPKVKGNRDLDYYYPTDVLVTDRGIIYFWVARMVMMGLANLKKVPFREVYIHGTILDELGRKMSKSLGNGIDPLDMIERYGADAVRFSLIMLTVEGQDLKLAESRFEMGRNFCNKLWNASRLVMTYLEEGLDETLGGREELAFEDRWILSRLGHCIREVTRALEAFQFNLAVTTLYEFVWHSYCDWYLEIVKPRLRGEAPGGGTARKTMLHVLDAILRLLHPVIPFVTEEIWTHLNAIVPSRGRNKSSAPKPLVASEWPSPMEEAIDEKIEEEMTTVQDIIRAVRLIRNKQKIAQRQPLEALVRAPDEQTAALILRHGQLIREQATLERLRLWGSEEKPEGSATEVVGTIEVYVPLEGTIDTAVERDRLLKRCNELIAQLKKIEAKLDNKDFLTRAPEQVVRREKERHEKLLAEYRKVQENLQGLLA